MRAVVAPTRDQIRERINKLLPIPTAARAVLIEVCNLVELAGKGLCYASNLTLADKACCHFKSVSRHLQTLERAGLVAAKYLTKSNASRCLIPSEQTLAICDGADPAALVAALKLVMWSDPKAADRLAKWSERTAPSLGAYCSEGSERTAPSSERSAPQIEYTRKEKELTDLRSVVAELQSALDAATAATQKKDEQILALGCELKAINEKWELGKEKGRNLYAQNTATIADLQTQLEQQPVALAKLLPTPRKKSVSCLMSESAYAAVAPFCAALVGTDYEHADLTYYHEVITNWSLSGSNKRTDWIATTKNWILKDKTDGKLKLNPNSQLIPSQHDKQQQSARAQQLGLYDPAKRQAARELLSAYRAGQ